MGALTYSGIRKTFAGQVALEHLDLEIGEGELISLLGPSGCGKTTALRIAAGFEIADSGTVSVGGTDITHLSAHKRNMGMVFRAGLFPTSPSVERQFGLHPQIDRSGRNRVADAGTGAAPHLAKRAPTGIRRPAAASPRQALAVARRCCLDERSALDVRYAPLRDGRGSRPKSESPPVRHRPGGGVGDQRRVGVMSQGLEQLGTPTEVYAVHGVRRHFWLDEQLPAACR
jgi:putative spermidine/putrescine transport system ATP-binding protein